jgi:hypothetical protein
MNYVKFGKTYINFDQATNIRDLSIDLPGGAVSEGVVRIEFEKDHIIDLVDGYQDVLNWLAQNAAESPVVVP